MRFVSSGDPERVARDVAREPVEELAEGELGEDRDDGKREEDQRGRGRPHERDRERRRPHGNPKRAARSARRPSGPSTAMTKSCAASTSFGSAAIASS